MNAKIEKFLLSIFLDLFVNNAFILSCLVQRVYIFVDQFNVYIYFLLLSFFWIFNMFGHVNLHCVFVSFFLDF
jgi:hypothetical protein